MQALLLSALITLNINPAVEVEFPTEKGDVYQVQRTWNIDEPNWEDIKEPVAGTGNAESIFVTKQKAHAFFRIVTIDSPKTPQGPTPPDPSAPDEEADDLLFKGFMKIHNDEPIGEVLHEGTGLLDAARFNAERIPALKVKAVEVRVKE